MDTSQAYSALAQVDDGFGQFVVAYLWIGVFASGFATFLAVPYTLIDMAWHFIGGSRKGVLESVIIIGLCYYISRNRVPWKFIALTAFPLVLIVGFMGINRYQAQKMENNSINLSNVMRGIQDTMNQGSDNGIARFVVTGIARFSDLDSIAAIYGGTPSSQPFLMGETYSRIPRALVPRQLWKDKPKMVLLPINEWFFKHDGGSSPITTPGEGYLNFGWYGVMLAAIVAAMFIRSVEWLFSRLLWNGAVLPIYVATLALFALIHLQGFTGWFTTIPKLIFVVVFIHLMTRPSRALYELKIAGEGILAPADVALAR